MQRTNIIEQKELRENPYRVPHGYFDLLPQLIGKKIAPPSKQESAPVHSLSFGKSLRSQLALAASFILMMGMGYGVVRLITPNDFDTDLSYTENISLFNSYSLLQGEEWEDELDSEEIISYLTDHGISPNALAFLD